MARVVVELHNVYLDGGNEDSVFGHFLHMEIMVLETCCIVHVAESPILFKSFVLSTYLNIRHFEFISDSLHCQKDGGFFV